MPAIGAIAGGIATAAGASAATSAIVGGVGSLAGGLISSSSANKAAKAQQNGIDAATQLQADIYNQNREDLAPYRNIGYKSLDALAYGMGLSDPYKVKPARMMQGKYYSQDTVNKINSMTNQQLLDAGFKIDANGFVVDGPQVTDASGVASSERQRLGVKYIAGNSAPGNATSYQQNEVPSGISFGDLTKSFRPSDLYTDPSYKWRLEQGQKALERSAAARGGLLSGGTLKDLTNYAQGAASQEYGNAYNRFAADRDSRFNKFSTLAGIGQTANSQAAQSGQTYADNTGSLAMARGQVAANNSNQQSNILSQTIGGLGGIWTQQSNKNNSSVWGT